MNDSKRSVPEGWYPAGKGREQYWTGEKWTNAFRSTEVEAPAMPVAAPTGKEPGSDALVVVGYITALLLPVIGFILGLILLLRRQTNHGLAVLLLSVLVVIIAWQVLLSDSKDAAQCLRQAETLREINACS